VPDMVSSLDYVPVFFTSLPNAEYNVADHTPTVA
jgi:hypothetical protein